MKRSAAFLPLSALVLVAFGALAVAGSSPAEADCLSAAECETLKTRLHDLRRDAREIRREVAELRGEARGLPADSTERQRLRRQVRALRDDLRSLRRREIRPAQQRFRSGCRQC